MFYTEPFEVDLPLNASIDDVYKNVFLNIIVKTVTMFFGRISDR